MSTDDQKRTDKLIRKVVKSGRWHHDTERGSHNQTYLVCAGSDDSGRQCVLTVYSTPKRGQPNILRRRVLKCPHGHGEVLA